jgi:hypothetical protein
MATLEALDELYSMGFLIEEEYLARRAALGAGPPAKGEPETKTETPTTSNDPYAYHHVAEPTVPEPIYNHVTTYEQPYQTYETPYSYDPAPETTPKWEPVEAPIETAFTPTIDRTEPTDSLTDTATRAPRDPIQPEGPYPLIHIDKEVESLSQLRISPNDDTSKAEVWTAHPDKATVIHRSEGRYLVRLLNAPSSAWEVQREFGLEGQIFESGKATVKTEKEMYWSTTTWVLPDPVSSVEAGKIYVFKQDKANTGLQYTYIDERVFMRYTHSLLEKTPLSSGVPDLYEGDSRIRDVRKFDGNEVPTPQDPRQAVAFLNSKLKPAFDFISSPGTGRTVTKVKCIPTPAFMLWPSLITVLRSLQFGISEDVTRHLPQTASEIWQRINKSLDNQECYFTGRPAAPGSFLTPELHKDNILELYHQIKENSLFPGSSNISNASVTEGVGSSKQSVPEWEERIHYEVGEAPRSYGWPTLDDSDNSPLAVPQLGIKPVSRTRQSAISELLSELITRNGPPAGSKTA